MLFIPSANIHYQIWIVWYQIYFRPVSLSFPPLVHLCVRRYHKKKKKTADVSTYTHTHIHTYTTSRQRRYDEDDNGVEKMGRRPVARHDKQGHPICINVDDRWLLLLLLLLYRSLLYSIYHSPSYVETVYCIISSRYIYVRHQNTHPAVLFCSLYGNAIAFQVVSIFFPDPVLHISLVLRTA